MRLEHSQRRISALPTNHCPWSIYLLPSYSPRHISPREWNAHFTHLQKGPGEAGCKKQYDHRMPQSQCSAEFLHTPLLRTACSWAGPTSAAQAWTCAKLSDFEQRRPGYLQGQEVFHGHSKPNYLTLPPPLTYTWYTDCYSEHVLQNTFAVMGSQIYRTERS